MRRPYPADGQPARCAAYVSYSHDIASKLRMLAECKRKAALCRLKLGDHSGASIRFDRAAKLAELAVRSDVRVYRAALRAVKARPKF